LPQVFLDPDDTTTTGTWTPAGPLPAAVRKFGRYLDTSALLPGDLILFNAKRPTITSRAIIRVQQRGGYREDDARWHHAAVYTGEDEIVEAVLHGVRHNPIFSYFPSHRTRVRRDASLTAPQRLSLVVKAMSNMRKNYSLGQLPLLCWDALRGYWQPAPIDRPSFVTICSEVYAKSYAAATMRYLCNPALIVKPADLSLTTLLTDVPLSWMQIA